MQQFNIFHGEYPDPVNARKSLVAEPQVAGRVTEQLTEPLHSGIEHASTRIHAAPGGQQTFSIFGGDNMSSEPRKAAPKASATSDAAGMRVEKRTENTGITEHASTRVHAAPGGQQTFSIFGGESEASTPHVLAANAPAPAPPDLQAAAGARVHQRSELTGISEHASTRVHRAPGGQQTFSLFANDVNATAADRIAAMKAHRAQTGAPPVDVTNQLGQP
jgi:hypothetical protein